MHYLIRLIAYWVLLWSWTYISMAILTQLYWNVFDPIYFWSWTFASLLQGECIKCLLPLQRKEHCVADIKTHATVGSLEVYRGSWCRSHDTSGRALAAQPRTNERPGGFARASWARSRVYCWSGVCAPLPTVTRCLNVMRCLRPPRVPGRRTGSLFLLAPFWLQPLEEVYRHSRFVVSLVLAVLAACGGLTGGFFCAACDTDKRLRRVRVPRMLPGKEERAFSHFILSLNVTFITTRAQQDIKVEGCRWI